MGRFKNPALFIMRYGIPFNFDMGWEDWDADYHDPDDTFAVLKSTTDPCQWSDEQKAAVNRQRDEWVAQYHAWANAPDDDEGEVAP